MMGKSAQWNHQCNNVYTFRIMKVTILAKEFLKRNLKPAAEAAILKFLKP